MFLCGLGLASCAKPEQPVTPAMYVDLSSPTAALDQQAALSLVNDYRRKEGLSPLTLDPALSAIAQEQASALAAKDDMKVALAPERKIGRRLAAKGYENAGAVENVSAGYRTTAEAFSGWREAKKENAHMLKADADRFGIAIAYAPGSKYRVFWAAIFAKAGA